MARFTKPSEEYIKGLLETKDAINTKRVTTGAVKCFRQYLLETGRDPTFENFEMKELDVFLREFYAGAKRGDGEMFKKSAIVSIRYGLKRFLKDQRDIYIVTDSLFASSNSVFRAVVTDLKKRGLGSVDHHPPISEGDLKKLYSGQTHVFDINTPVGLQRKVWFELMLYLCRRGRENLREMSRDTFRIARDDDGLGYVYQHKDELDKNHRGENCSNDLPTEGRIYELKGEAQCHVASFRKYVSKLNGDIDCLWQRPRDSFIDDDAEWYCAAPVGKNPLGVLMCTISKAGKLSREYTNHSIRATSITIMDRAGISDRHIMRISGHRSENSLKHYSQHVTDRQKREISGTLNNALMTKKNINQSASVSSLGYIDNVPISELINYFSEENVDTEPVSKALCVKPKGSFNFTPVFSSNCSVTININNNQNKDN